MIICDECEHCKVCMYRTDFEAVGDNIVLPERLDIFSIEIKCKYFEKSILTPKLDAPQPNWSSPSATPAPTIVTSSS